MHTSVRTLGFVGAILLLGGVAGVTLGNFVTAGGADNKTGAEELAAYWSEAGLGDDEPTFEDRQPTALATRNGPTSYHCEGCDSGLHRVPEYLETLPADYAPLPPYEAVDLKDLTRPRAAARAEVPSIPPRPREPVPAERPPAAALRSAPLLAE